MISKRLQNELVHLHDTSLKETGIYYFIQDELITKGTAIMFGPIDTPYEFCPLEYSFDLPSDYPYVPPKVLYKTNDGNTRFHPNFYIDGKVCLSILGTYSGPKWASSMSISTVLLSIYSVLINNPLNQEPSFENTPLTNIKNTEYAQYVEHNIIKLFIQQYNDNYYKKYEYDESFKTQIAENYKKIKQKVIHLAKNDEIVFNVLPYSMIGKTMYKKLV